MSLAQCNVCSHYDNNIAVICERRCLICFRCQSNQVIQQLLVDSLHHGSGEALCPLCEKPMSRTMAGWCRSVDKMEQAQGGVEVLDGARVVSNLNHIPSPYSSFLRRFKITYGDLGGVADVRPGNDNEPEVKKEKPSYSTEITYYPPKFSVVTALEFASECFCSEWATILKAGDESMCSALQKQCSKKKMTQRANDFKAKGILDYFGAPDATLETSPILILFGRITGILPRSKTKGYLVTQIRKAWGTVATCVMVIAYCERCWKLGEIKSENDEPSVQEVRTRLNKFATNKQFSIRRSLRLLQILFASSQPHWSMAPYLGACREYSSNCPWGAESMARLFHFMFWVSSKVMEDGFEGYDLAAQMETKAKELWRAVVKPRAQEDIQFGNVSPLEGVENAFMLDMVTMDEAMERAGNNFLTAAHLALAFTEAWEQEALLINENLTRAVISSTRRMAVRGVFRPECATISIAEKNCVVKILKWYANNLRKEVDWEEVRALNLQRVFPFHVPDSLMEKSTAELNHHAENIAIDYDMRKSEELLQDMDTFAARTLPLTYTNEAPPSMTRDDMMWEDDRDDLSDAKFRLTKEGAPKPKKKEKKPKLTKGEQERLELVTDMPPLSTLTFKAPIEPRNPLNMADILENDPEVLQRLRLLNRIPIGPHSEEKRLRALNDDISGFFSLSHKSAATEASESIASMSIADESTIAESQDDVDDDTSLGSAVQVVGAGGVADRDNPALEGPPPEARHDEASSQQNLIGKGNGIEGSRDADPGFRIKRRTHAKAMTARGRVQAKIEQKKRDDRRARLNEAQGRINQYEATDRSLRDEMKRKEKFRFDLHSVVQAPDEEIDAAQEAENMLAAEHAHKRLMMKDGPVDIKTITRVANNHFQKWQIEELEDLEMTDARLGPEGTLILADKFKDAGVCRLSRLFYGGNQTGETGSISFLKAIVQSGGDAGLAELDLHSNMLTMVSEGFMIINKFVNLTYLDLRANHIAIDNPRHMSLLVDSLEPLKKLVYLSLAENRLQNMGLSALINNVLPGMLDLQTLDLNHAFLTPESFENIFFLVKKREPIIQLIDYTGNIIKNEEKSELRYFANLRGSTFTMD